MTIAFNRSDRASDNHCSRAWRQRVAARYRRPSVHLPVGRADNLWPVFSPAFPRCWRWPMNSARWYAARVLWFPGCLLPPVAMSAIPERAPTWLEALVLVMSAAVAAIINEKRGLKPGIYYQHRAARGFANLVALSWLATAAFVGAAAAAVAMLLLFALWLPITIASFVGTNVLLRRGWLPPSAAADVTLAATIDEFLTTVSGTPTRSTGSEPDPWHFNDDHDPHLRLDREHLAELRRANDLYERDLNGNRTATVTAPQVAASAPQKRTAAPLAFIAAGALIVVVGAYLWGMKADVPQPAQWPEIHAEAAK